jgi:hypothetical protein
MACMVLFSALGVACMVEFLCNLCGGCALMVFGVLVGTGSHVSSLGDLLWFWMSLLCWRSVMRTCVVGLKIRGVRTSRSAI